MRMKRLLCFGLMMALLCGACAFAEKTPTPMLLRQQVDTPNGFVSYPQLSDYPDAVVQQQVNTAILAAGEVEERITRLQSLPEDTVGLRQGYEALLHGDVLSVTFSAQGALRDSGFTHEWVTLNMDLTTGQPLTLDDLFTDADAAKEAITAYIDQRVSPELSAHLEVSSLTPLPETFGLSAEGITFYYDLEHFTTLGGLAGKVTLLYDELRDYLKLGEGAVLTRLGAEDVLTLSESSVDAIRTAVEAGQLPGVPAKVGDSLGELIETYDLLIDPDYYPGGRFFQLEDGAFRGTYLLTDALTDGWENSVVQGIRADRANFYGLCIGSTTQEEWRAVLGEPDASVALNEDDAYAYNLETGTSDYYNDGGHQLRLHADAEGVLRNIFITQ